MKKMIKGILSFLSLGIAMNTHAVIVSNLLADAGFEALAGNEPNDATSPWFTIGEAQIGSFISATNQVHGGSQSAKFNYYYDAGDIAQNTGLQIEAGKDYVVSMWMLIAEPSANPAHTNSTDVAMELFGSDTVDGTYTLAVAVTNGLPATTNQWQQFTQVWKANDLLAIAGKYVQVRYAKVNANTLYKIHIDDTAFGEHIPVLPGRLISWDSSTQAGGDYSQTSVTGTFWSAKMYALNTTQGSTDGTFGSAETGASTLPTCFEVRTATPDDTDTCSFRIINNTGSPIQLDSISFDYSRWSENAPQGIVLKYAWGDLEMAGNTFINSTSSLPIAAKLGDYTDFDWSLAGIGDRILADGKQANFSLIVTNAIGAFSSGAFDNIAIFGQKAEPRTETFHLDASNGSDFNSGLSSNQAWQTFDRLNLETFGPGAQILFKRGDVFTGRWVFKGNGTAASPIIVGAYGNGAKPLLQGGASSKEVIYITNSRGFEIRDLKISNNHPAGTIWDRYGINLVPPVNAGDLEHIYFDNLDVTDIAGTNDNHECRGIWVNTDTADDAPVLSRWNDFRIKNCRFENIDGRAVQVRDGCHNIVDLQVNGLSYYPSIGVVFQNNTGKDCYRNLVQIQGTQNALIQNNYMDGTIEGSAFWPFATEGTLVQFNEFRDIKKPGADASACHFDYNCIDTLMQYNFGYNVEGSLIQVLNNSNGTNFQINAVARYNIGIDCGWRNSDNSAGIMITGDATGSKIYNNTLITTDLHPAYKAISFNNWGGDWPVNSLIANNIFFAADIPQTYANESQMLLRGNVVTHNLYTGNVAVCSADVSPVTGNPRFANPSGTNAVDFKVTYGSAAIGEGMLIADNGGRDYFNNPVSSTNAPTIGFHEYQTDAYIDTDTDGMPDLWETTYGLAPTNSVDSGIDSDDDKQSNLAEYIADTNPNDIASLFLATLQPSAQQLYWNASPDRLYTILHSPDLQSWETVESNVASPYSIDMSGLKGFYKIQVEVPVP